MKINVLSSKIYNRIAAGEVVERPASVVKELVENSIDAGATNVTIDIENGGISSIVITDNGCGIEKAELKKALLPHATSKISTIKDLDNIRSLGFRGEALASIASVSKLTITSKPSTQEMGAQIFSNGGEMSLVSDCSAVDGSIIAVKNLFFNTPAREKFLRSERSEENEITTTIERFILGNNNISFKYIADGKTIYNSYGEGLASAMACVYGIDVIDNCFYIDTVKNGIKIQGYVGKHHYTKGNRSHQTCFVNNRFVQNSTISSAISNAYSSYLMKRQYPFYVLNITMPTEIVDINVHPQKLDIRFVNNQIVYGAIYSVISKVLDGSSEAISIVVDNIENLKKNNNDFDINYVTHNNANTAKKFERLTFFDSNISNKNELGNIQENAPSNKNNIGENNTIDIFAENKLFLENLERQKQAKEHQVIIEQISCEKDFYYIGQALNTYLVFEDGKDLYLADQHAAHERILFDKLNDSLKKSCIVTQPLLLPYVLNVSNDEYDFLSSNINSLKSMGIELNEFGRNAFKVSTVPSFLTEMNLQRFFDDVLADLVSLKSISINSVLVEKLAQKACKAAIKSGDKLSQPEIDVLMQKLKENIGLKCPHGRPVAIKINRTEIDKWFKRII